MTRLFISRIPYAQKFSYLSSLNISPMTAPAQASVAPIAISGNVGELSGSIGYKKMVFSPIAVHAGCSQGRSQELSYTSKSMSLLIALVAGNVAPSVNKSSVMVNSTPRSKEGEGYWHIAVFVTRPRRKNTNRLPAIKHNKEST